MNWEKVGEWLQENAGGVLGLAGAVATGNLPAGVALVASMVGEATGTDHPGKALARLKADPETMVRLEEIAKANESDIRKHHREMLRLRLEDEQAQHRETQDTVRGGDKAEDVVVRRTRPLQSWASLIAAFFYVVLKESPDIMILGALLVLPWTYAGLRQTGKLMDAWVSKTPQL